MFGKKEKKEESQPSVNPELLQVERQYKREALIVESQPILKRVGLLIWLTVDVILIALFVLSLVLYLVTGARNDRHLISSIAEDIGVMHEVSSARSASPLSLEGETVISLGDGEYDFYAEVENPNARWYATFTYQFTSSQGDTEWYEGSVMPLERRPVFVIREPFSTRPSGAQLELDNVVWHRVDAGEVQDIDLWLQERNAFDVQDASYTFDLELDGEEIPRTSFSITNNTPFSYWDPQFVLLIERAGRVAGLNVVTLSNFASGETREVDVNWFGAVPSSGTVRVVPNINYFDSSVYMSSQVQGETDIRDTLQDAR